MMAEHHDNPFHCEGKTPGKTCERRKIVIACDGSEHSERALNLYLDDMMKPDDHIILYHAFEMPALPVAPYPYGFSYYEDWSKYVQQAERDATMLLQGIGKHCVEKVRARFPEADQQTPHIQLFRENGRAGELICNFCKEIRPAMLIVGSRGQGTFRRTLLGSVSDYCIHHNDAHVPVVIVPPPPEHCDQHQEKQE